MKYISNVPVRVVVEGMPTLNKLNRASSPAALVTVADVFDIWHYMSKNYLHIYIMFRFVKDG